MKLTVQHLHNATTFTCQLQPPGGTIGRGEHNDLNLPDPTGDISSLQAIIRIEDAAGTGSVLNMSSMSRVAINDTLLGLSQEANISHGSRITVGDYLISVDQAEASAPASATPSAHVNATPLASVTAATAASASHPFADALKSDASPDEPLPTWHPAYQPETNQSAGSPSADPYASEHPLGTPINRMPPPTPAPNTTVAPMSSDMSAMRAPHESPQDAAPADTFVPPAPPPVPEEDPDDIFKDLLSGPGVLPVGGTTADDRHPFDMDSATDRNHHNPVELLKPEGMHHPSIDGDPLEALPTDGTDKDRYTIFSDDSPTTLNKDTALDSHKQDNILDTLQRAAHAGYKDKVSDKK